MDVVAQVLFTDIRGFTKWGEDTEVFANLDTFITSFDELLHKTFAHASLIKGLGDGAMIVTELGTEATPPTAKEIDTILKSIQTADKQFDRLCSDFGRKIGHETILKLGWGVVRGKVKKTNGDYIGPNLNRSARLCNEARPYGIVIDKADYPDPPTVKQLKFYPQIRKLAGIGEVAAWVTEAIGFEFITRERIKHTPEVHVAGLCIDANDRRGLRILLAKRADTRKLFPSLLEGCGGQLAESESFADGVVRHFRLEMNIEVRVLEDLHCFYVIHERHEPTLIPGIRFLCERVGEADPKSNNHSWVGWYSEKEFKELPGNQLVGKLKEEGIQLLNRYKNLRKGK